MTSQRAREFLIVGGGPAGASAAIALASAGRDVVILERAAYARPRIGETLPPAANPVLDRLGLDRAALGACGTRCPGSASVWGGEEPYRNDALFDPDGDGLHLDRAAFDRLLADRSAAAGADVKTEHCLRSCRRNGPMWLITISGPDGIHEVGARTLIDASGRAPWPGRLSRRKAFDRQVALVALYEAGEGPSLDRRTWIESTQDGWWYSAALPGARVVAAYFTDADLLFAPKECREGRLTDLLGRARWTRGRLRGGRLLGQPRVVSASSSIANPIVGDGWVAVGDAASTIDPLSSQGILYAMTSGLEAAEALLAPGPAEGLSHYSRAITVRLGDDLATRAAFCRRERRWADSPFWQRRTSPSAVPQPAMLGPHVHRSAPHDDVLSASLISPSDRS
jgi:flavin-dependent dehydrogenase